MALAYLLRRLLHQAAPQQSHAAAHGGVVPAWGRSMPWIDYPYNVYMYIYIWYMIYDIWYMIYEIWYMIYEIWYMIYDIWYMVYDIWYMIYDLWNIIYDIVVVVVDEKQTTSGNHIKWYQIPCFGSITIGSPFWDLQIGVPCGKLHAAFDDT